MRSPTPRPPSPPRRVCGAIIASHARAREHRLSAGLQGGERGGAEFWIWRALDVGCPPFPPRTPFPTRILASPSPSSHLPGLRLMLPARRRPPVSVFPEWLLRCFPGAASSVRGCHGLQGQGPAQDTASEAGSLLTLGSKPAVPHSHPFLPPRPVFIGQSLGDENHSERGTVWPFKKMANQQISQEATRMP